MALRTPIAKARGLGTARAGLQPLEDAAADRDRQRAAGAVVHVQRDGALGQRLRPGARLAGIAGDGEPHGAADHLDLLPRAPRPAGRGRGLRPSRGAQDRIAGGDRADRAGTRRGLHRRGADAWPSEADDDQGISDHGSPLRLPGRRRRRLGPARRGRHGRGRPQDRLRLQGLSDALAHGLGAGRHQRRARQHRAGRLALPHVRHGQGLGLAGRPGRDRVHDQERAGRGDRARALRRAVLAHRRRQDLPARVRRPVDRVRQEAGVPHLRRRRPDRPRHAAHDVPAGAQEQGGVLQRVLRARPDHRRGQGAAAG